MLRRSPETAATPPRVNAPKPIATSTNAPTVPTVALAPPALVASIASSTAEG